MHRYGIFSRDCNPGGCTDELEKPAYDDFRAQVAALGF